MNTLPDRIASKIGISTSGCWLWTAGKFASGYGGIWDGRAMLRAHRVVYEILVGPIPAGLVLDHICFVRSCVNPSHLRPATQKQNMEHRSGNQTNNTSGYRGVVWDESRGKWQVKAQHAGRMHFGGRYSDLLEAAAAALELRNALFTHNDERDFAA